MNKLEQAARQALEALERASAIMDSSAQQRQDDAITALRDALGEQAEQRSDSEQMEPVAWLYRGELHWENPSEWAKSEVIPLYTDIPQSNTQQEPIARVPAHPRQGLEWFKPPPVWGTLLYAAPVRTKDLTDDEIETLFEYWYSQPETEVWSTVDLARDVIAADREKNRG